jgi:hypothetical protein
MSSLTLAFDPASLGAVRIRFDATPFLPHGDSRQETTISLNGQTAAIWGVDHNGPSDIEFDVDVSKIGPTVSVELKHKFHQSPFKAGTSPDERELAFFFHSITITRLADFGGPDKRERC